MSRWLSPLMAFCLSFLLITTLAPVVGIQFDRQLDFWALWLVLMVVLALPFAYLEVALVKRAKTTALQALMSLTREADASARWRIAGWLAVVFMPFLAGALIANAGHSVVHYTALPVPENILFAVLAVIAVAASFLPRLILMGAGAVMVLISLVLSHMFPLNLSAWHVTALQFSEWGYAVVLALVASGLGLGVYAQTSALEIKNSEQATASALPVWIAQLVAVVLFGFFAVQAQIPAITILVGSVVAAAGFVQLAREQLQQRQIAVLVQWAIILVAILTWACLAIVPVLNTVLMLWGLLICLIYAIFVGWIMKISHLRKALNFSQEMTYNLWRIAVRIVAPLAIVLAIISIVLGAV
ncbi:hypothetical protein [Acinetobacter sp. MB5]|uniref:hypothetical protein n=1 Tax=Acinetobacter sp. MB5 TaxID=2069438 RepID=UPI000DCF90C6|nr:hypothetical protein [Acinetobacter sp. MB5]